MHYRCLLAKMSAIIVPALAVEFPFFTSPSSWRKPDVTSSLDERISTTDDAIQRVIKTLEKVEFATPSFYALASDFDALTNQTRYKTVVDQYFSSVASDYKDTINTNTALGYGIAAIRAFAVYRNHEMLDLAINIWSHGRTYTISDADVNAGKITSKAFALAGSCEGATMAGGTFWITNENDSTIFGDSTGQFFALSSYLANITSNLTYLDAAKESGTFMLANLNITNEGNGKAAMSAKVGDSCNDSFGPGTFRIDGPAGFIEGLAMLPPEAVLGAQTVEDLRVETVNITLTTNGLCNDPSGIINVGNGIGSQGLVSALAMLYKRETSSTALRTYIQKYLSVQYNAVMDLSTTKGSGIYAGSWSGPPATKFSADNQTAALAVLVAGISLSSPPANSTDGPNHDGGGSGTVGRKHKFNLAGAIAGGVVGGILLNMAIVLVILWCLRRRRRRRLLEQQQRHQEEMQRATSFEPFTVTEPSTPLLPPGTSAGHRDKNRRSGWPRKWGNRRPSLLPASPLSVPNTAGLSSYPAEGGDNISTEHLLQLVQERIRGERSPPEYDHDNGNDISRKRRKTRLVLSQ
ncbi:hypothetical protein FPV67DRAFT_625578 [Lyophyllum atratum]|nr:hypothetical protein FPV67DRAFT_625578 [Lyophyllum atratum]